MLYEVTINIKRKIIEVSSVVSRILWERENIAYIHLKSFNEKSDKQFFKVIKKRMSLIK